MSEVRLVVRDVAGDWSGTIHGSSADCAVAALSADPVTLAELEAACGRYQKLRRPGQFFFGFSPGLNDEPYDAGLVVIDLVARLVVADSTYSAPGPTGEVRYHNGECATERWLQYHLAEDWLFAYDQFGWESLANKRRSARAAQPPLDARAVFYGKPLIEYVAREVFAAQAGRTGPDFETYDSIKNIHAAWMLTPRQDLRGACPREIALERHRHIGWDLQHQANRWSALDESPPGLDPTSFAFRYGGFGTHELVLYYDLVRELLGAAWERLEDATKAGALMSGPAALTVGDFLTSEVPRLEELRDAWFESPNPEFSGRVPRSVIDRERARLPEAMTRHEAIVDPDCPCCQMLADMPGPVFWHLDGCNMDPDFAFDYWHLTREEWEAEQREWEERSRRFDAEREERKRLGVSDSGHGQGDGENALWTSTFSVGDAANVPVGIRLFGIGCRLAEIIAELRGDDAGEPEGPEARRLIDGLNRDFGNLRELLQNSEASLAAALIDPVLDRFAETLSDAGSGRPDLSPRCEDLAAKLKSLLAPPSTEWNEGDEDLPF